MKVAAHPGLYDPGQEPPALHGTRCRACGTTYFPPTSIGCETCGAPEASLSAATLIAAGMIHSVATVYRHTGGDIEVPFTIAEVLLDDGPLIRAAMAEVVEPTMIGRRVVARFVLARADDEGNEIVEPRFTVETP